MSHTVFFSVRLFMVLRGHSFFHPRHNGQWTPPTSKDFYTRSYPLHYFLISYFLRKSQYFAFQCWVLNKGTTGTIFITSSVWRSPWLGIEPGTSRTRSQHSTTRLSRRRWSSSKVAINLLYGISLIQSRFLAHFGSAWLKDELSNSTNK